MGERTPEERPPWEPKTRYEMEQEVDSSRVLQRRLGDSVAWIVDTLLQSEDAKLEEADNIRKRKQGALESLAYVRDVLQGRVTTVEEDRLWDEEEIAKRRAPPPPFIPPVPTIPPVQPAAVAPPIVASRSLQSASTAPVSAAKGITSTRFNAHTPTSPFMPRFSPPAPPPLSPPINVTPSPGIASPGAMPLAPWSYTTSEFSAPTSTVVPPRPASAALPRTPSPMTNIPSTATRPVVMAASQDRLGTSKRGRQEVVHDPLGALR
jgi:TBC1 domain family protein 5